MGTIPVLPHTDMCAIPLTSSPAVSPGARLWGFPGMAWEGRYGVRGGRRAVGRQGGWVQPRHSPTAGPARYRLRTNIGEILLNIS